MKTKEKSFYIILLMDLILIFCVIFGKEIVKIAMDILPTCPFLKLGVMCPACGGTRCTLAILNLNFVEAFKLNPFIFLMLFYVAIAFISANLYFIFGFKIPQKIYKAMIHYKTIIFLAIAFTAFGVIRNLI